LNDQAHLPQGGLRDCNKQRKHRKGQQAKSPRPLRAMCSAWFGVSCR